MSESKKTFELIKSQARPGALNDLSRGYEHFLADRAGAASINLAQVIVVLDTNVLLDLYRSPDQARDELIAALKNISDSLFMPAQVQREFWRNRDGVLLENKALDEVVKNLREMLRNSKKSLGKLGQGKIGTEPAEVMISQVETTLEAVIKKADSYRPVFDWRAALSSPSRDAVLQTLLTLYAGKVGSEYSSEDLSILLVEGVERFSRKIPPGYADAEKYKYEEAGAGDFLLWKQVISQAQATQKNVVLVTRDVKEDWWRLDAWGKPINARFELVEEMRQCAGVELHLLETAEFIRILEEMSGSPVSERTIQEVDELSSTKDSADTSMELSTSWTVSMLETLIERLEQNGYGEQSKVLKAARAAPDGRLSRAEVLSELKREPDAKITGFTRAISSATNQLVNEGILLPVAEPALWAEYDGPGKAISFVTPVLSSKNPRL